MIRFSEVTQGESDVVRPKEVLESFPNEGKHESVPRVKHMETQSTTDLSVVQWERRCPSGPRLERLDCRALVSAGESCAGAEAGTRFPQGGHNSWHSLAFLLQLDQPGCTDCN